MEDRESLSDYGDLRAFRLFLFEQKRRRRSGAPPPFWTAVSSNCAQSARIVAQATDHFPRHRRLGIELHLRCPVAQIRVDVIEIGEVVVAGVFTLWSRLRGVRL